jgi:hypothetical protein
MAVTVNAGYATDGAPPDGCSVINPEGPRRHACVDSNRSAPPTAPTADGQAVSRNSSLPDIKPSLGFVNYPIPSLAI